MHTPPKHPLTQAIQQILRQTTPDSHIVAKCTLPITLAATMLFVVLPVSATTEFREVLWHEHPLKPPVDVGSSSTPTFVDIDNDSDLDVFIGSSSGVFYFENVGDISHPLFEERIKSANPLRHVKDKDSFLSFTDIDNDADQDVFIGNNEGTVKYYENTGSANAPVFKPRQNQANPLAAIEVGFGSMPTPVFADIDEDGDVDAFIGSSDGMVQYYENVGNVSNPVFEKRTGIANPLREVAVRFDSSPHFVDIDQDFDLDVFVGNRSGLVAYYENVGTAKQPRFEKAHETANLLRGVKVTGGGSTPTFADLDNDGDWDAFIGNFNGTIQYYENKGKMNITVFEQPSATANPLENAVVPGFSAPTLIDIDHDFDLDAFIGGWEDVVKYYENIGTPNTPIFKERTGTANPLGRVESVGNPILGFVDIDNDADWDVFMGTSDGTLSYYENTGNLNNPVFEARVETDNPLAIVDVAINSAPVFVDIDQDKDWDVFIGIGGTKGKKSGTISYYENIGNASQPLFEERTELANPLGEVDVGWYSAPHFVDMDNDGDWDMVSGEIYGTLKYYQNKGTNTQPIFAEATDIVNPMNEINVGLISIPSFGDIDDDFDLDIVIGTLAGVIVYYENTGNAQTAQFEKRFANNPLHEIDVGINSTPSLVDIDNDGDWDIFIGERDGIINYYENIGTSYHPRFEERTDAANPLGEVKIENDTSDTSAVDVDFDDIYPKFIDIDNDGDWDAFIGGNHGVLKYYENVGNVNQPTFLERTDTKNPLNGIDNGSVPSFFDIDNDGDQDLFIGENTIHYYENVGNASTPVFEARQGMANPLNKVDEKSFALHLIDIDNDKDGDVLLGVNDTILFYENIGTVNQPQFQQSTSTINPLAGVSADATDITGISLVDIDFDNDRDAFIGTDEGSVKYYENKGSAKRLVFEENQDTNPLGGLKDMFWQRQSGKLISHFVDIDNDGDKDVFFGTMAGTIEYYQNVGNAQQPLFEKQTGAANPLANVDMSVRSFPYLVDIDNDGDKDAFIGDWFGTIKYYENIGTASHPQFEVRTGIANPLNGIDVGNNSTLSMIDFENDHDWDVFIGAENGTIRYFENTGSVNFPHFVERTETENPLNGTDVGLNSIPYLFDFDQDGDWDAFIGGSKAISGKPGITYYENVSTASTTLFEERIDTANPLGELATDVTHKLLNLVDIDNDGDWDAFINASNILKYYENVSGKRESIFTERPDLVNSLNNVARGFSSSYLVDIDNDEDLDVFIGEGRGFIDYYENIGNATNPWFQQRLGDANPLDSVKVHNDSAPNLIDLDNDGDRDAVIGADVGQIAYFENIGNAEQPLFEQRSDSDNPFQSVKLGKSTAPHLVDFDNDGDFDLFVGRWEGVIDYYENVGNAKQPIFEERTDSANPFNGIIIGKGAGSSTPYLVDFDNDGDFDALSGEIKGITHYFENIGNANTPEFVERIGTDNPFHNVIAANAGEGFGSWSTISAVDIDSDGDVDAFVGHVEGTIQYHKNTSFNHTLPANYALPSGNHYNGAREINLGCLGCDKIYYTLDGTMPNIASTEFTTPFQITTNTTLKFFTVDSQGQASEIITETYLIDTAPPTITITSPANHKALLGIAAIEGTVSESVAGVGLDRIELQIKNVPLYISSHHKNPFTTSLTWLPIPLKQNWRYSLSELPFPTGNYTIIARAFDKAGNVAEDRINITIEQPAFTTLSLSLGSQTLLQNGLLEATGKLQRFPDNTQEPANEIISLMITAPDETTAMHTTTTDSLGNYLFTDLSNFTHKGVYTLQAIFAGQETLVESQSTVESVLVGTFAGYAILVQGKIPNEEGIAAHNKTLNRVYKKLKERGFIDDNIRYFNYNTQQDSDADGNNDIFARPDKGLIQESIENWARERVEGAPAPFYLVMVDHGNPNAFLINNETITPPELDTWLNTLESGLTEFAKAEPRVIILGACYSGSFIPSLSNPGRVIISSAAADEESYKGTLEEDGIRSGEFFLEAFFQQLGRGKSLKDAFEQATQRTEEFTRQGELSANTANRFLDNAVQHPLLDDNGDGVGSNVLVADDDGQRVANLFLGAGRNFDTNSFENPALIENVTPTQYLGDSDNVALLFLTANNSGEVDPARLEIRPPQKQLSHQGSSEQVEIDLDSKFMPFNSATRRFETTHDGFVESGKYEIFYTVRDKDTRDISPVKRSVVYKNRTDNTPPQPFQLISPHNGSETQTIFLLDWENTTDPNNEPLSYTLTIAKDKQFKQIVHQQQELTISMTYVDNEIGLQDQTTYYWKIEAVDYFGSKTSSEVFSFTTNNTNAPPNIGNLHVFSAVNFTSLEHANIHFFQLDEFGNPIAMEQPPVIHQDQGFYHTLLPQNLFGVRRRLRNPVTRHARIQATGFTDKEIIFTPDKNGIATLNVAMEPIEFGKGTAIDDNGKTIETQTIFAATVNGKAYQSPVTLSSAEPINISGEITVDSQHFGQTADILIVAGYTPNMPNGSEQFFMVDTNQQLHSWEGDIGTLVAASEGVTLETTKVVDIYSGLLDAGQMRIFFGYRLGDGVVVFNGVSVDVITNAAIDDEVAAIFR